MLKSKDQISEDIHFRISPSNRTGLKKYLESKYGVDWKTQRVTSSTCNEALNKFLKSEGF